MSESADPGRHSRLGIVAFFAILAGLGALRVAIVFLRAPLGWVPILTIVVTIVFVAAPIIALFRAASERWTPKLAMLFLAGGIALHVGAALIASRIEGGLVAGFAAVAQIGLVSWCVGLGALLATKLKDKNLLIPITIFLAAFDLFLVFSPVGPTKLIMQAAPKVLPAVGYAIPKFGSVAPYAFVGPADFVFMAMFFVALFRFDMRSRATLIALIPTLLAYLLLSALFGAIPLLPPIAAVVLLANYGEFRLNKEELASTAIVAALSALLVIWGATRTRPPAEPGPPAPSPVRQGPAS